MECQLQQMEVMVAADSGIVSGSSDLVMINSEND